METLTGLRVFATVLALVACGSDPQLAPPGIHFPIYDADGPQPLALLDGRLEVESGCVYIGQGGERWLGLWPNDLRAQLQGNSLRIVDAHGEVLATEGEAILVGGGERRASELGGFTALNEWFAKIGGTSIPTGCGDLAWQVSGIIEQL